MLLTLDSLEETRLTAAVAGVLSARAPHRFTFAIGTIAIEVAMSDIAALEDFRYRFGDLSAERAADYTFFVVEDAHRAYFWSDPSRVRMWSGGSLGSASLSFLADNAAMDDFFARGRYVGLHAAVLKGARGLCALVGSTTAGKTTTAVACTRRGMRLYSDERCILSDGEVFAFPRALTLRAGGRELLATDTSGDAAFLAAIGQWGDVPEATVRPSQLFPGRVGGPNELLRVLIVLDGVGDGPRMDRVSLPSIVPQLAEAMSPASYGLDRVAHILSAFKTVECYRLRLGGPDETARNIVELMTR